MSNLSRLAQTYPASGIRRMFDLAASYDDVVNLCLGEPDFDTPVHVCEAAKAALDKGYTHYTPNAGLPALRDSISTKYAREYGLEYERENVVISTGAIEAILLSLLAIVNPGDDVIVPDPAFPAYAGQLALVGANSICVPVYEENDFRLQATDIEKAITPSTRALLLNSPSNPLGAVLEEEDLEAIAAVAKRHNLMVISDEVYEKIIFDGRVHHSITQIEGMQERTVIINGFSKTYAMTGWRLGYLLAPNDIVTQMPKMQEGIVSCLPAFIQEAGLAALEGSNEPVNDMVKQYTHRRNILIDGLNAIPGISCQKPSATFYAFPNIKAFGKTSVEFAEELLKEAGVVTVPGSAFGSMGEGYLRLSFANSDENLKEAVRRIRAHVERVY